MGRHFFTFCSAVSMLVFLTAWGLWPLSSVDLYQHNASWGGHGASARTAPGPDDRRSLTVGTSDGALHLETFRLMPYVGEPFGISSRQSFPGVEWSTTPGLSRSIQQRFDLQISLWLIAALAMPLPVAWTLAFKGRRVAAKRGLCPSCGYDLRASPERCPECGEMAKGPATSA